MTTGRGHFDSNVEVAFLTNSRRRDDTAILIGKSSYCQSGSLLSTAIATEHAPPSSTRSRNEFSPYVLSKYLLMEAAPCELRCQQGVTFSTPFIGMRSPAESHANRLNRLIRSALEIGGYSDYTRFKPHSNLASKH